MATTPTKYSAGSSNSVLKGNKILAYPLQLGDKEKDIYDKDYQFMMFNINTSIGSSRLREDKEITGVVAPNTRTGTGIGTVTGTSNAERLYSNKFTIEQIKKESWVEQKNMVRTDRVVVLPMPNDHNIQTAVQYDSDYDQSLLTQSGDTLNQLFTGNAFNTINDVVSMAVVPAMAGGINGIVKSVKEIVGMDSGRDVTSSRGLLASQRLAMNPKKEVMFKSFGFREFTFNFLLVPKNKQESVAVNEIIESFRFYSLPEIADSKLFYTLPGEFEISFILGNKDNPNIPKIDTCVCTRVSVNYSPSNMSWATLPNGAPVAINLTLHFTELTLIDRKRVYNKDSAITSGY